MKRIQNKSIFSGMSLVTLLPALLCSFLFNPLGAEAAGKREQEIDVLLKEDANIEEVKKDILKKDKNIQIEIYKDINLMHLVYPETVDVDGIMQDENIQNEIEVAGTLPKMEVPDGPLDDLDISDVTTESEVVTPGIDEKAIFDAQAWHVDEVTDGRKSLDYATGKGVKIAHIDSGVDTGHPVFSGKLDLIHAKSYVDGDDTITDNYGHGTETAGLIAQIAPDAVITPYKVLGADGGGESIWTMAAIIDAVNDGNDVINLSLGTYKCVDDSEDRILIATYKRAVRYAVNNNVTVFASSGNKGEDLDRRFEDNRELHLPGEIEGVNTIGDVWNEERVSISNFGKCVDYCAPGGGLVLNDNLVDINALMYVLYPRGMKSPVAESLGVNVPDGYGLDLGTSLSSAVATACFADIYSYGKEKSSHFRKDDAMDLMIAGCKDIGEKGKDVQFGNGEINIWRSINEIEPVYKGVAVQEDNKTRSYSNNSLTSKYEITEEDEDRYYVNVTLTNNTSKNIHKWEIAMDLDDEIDHMWDGSFRKDGDEIIVSHADYDQDIGVGESVSFGFIAKKSSSDRKAHFPDEILLISDKYMVKPEDYSADLEITTKWGDGFVAYVTIENKSDRTISDWKLEFTYGGNIDKIWGATVEEHDGDYYSILNEGSNQNIKPGKSVSFGFETSNSFEETIDNVSLISINK